MFPAKKRLPDFLELLKIIFSMRLVALTRHNHYPRFRLARDGDHDTVHGGGKRTYFRQCVVFFDNTSYRETERDEIKQPSYTDERLDKPLADLETTTRFLRRNSRRLSSMSLNSLFQRI